MASCRVDSSISPKQPKLSSDAPLISIDSGEVKANREAARTAERVNGWLQSPFSKWPAACRNKGNMGCQAHEGSSARTCLDEHQQRQVLRKWVNGGGSRHEARSCGALAAARALLLQAGSGLSASTKDLGWHVGLVGRMQGAAGALMLVV